MRVAEDPLHRAWLRQERERLLDFAKGSRDSRGGFGWLDDHGVIDPTPGIQLWITARMTHVFALAQLEGKPGAAAFVDHGVAGLMDTLRDSSDDGWYHSLAGPQPDATGKHNYAHAFVILAASSACAAGHPDGQALLAHALAVHTAHFWDEAKGLTKENFARDWTQEERYRGVNSAMHTVEAYLAASDVTGDTTYLSRAVSITARVVNGFARHHDWLLPEHFTRRWEPLLEYNADQPAHPFRPYGVTIGHLLEWSRLTLQVEAAAAAAGLEALPWARPAAVALYDEAVASGWNADGAEGFVYTIDYARRPVVRSRMHWVVAEAIGAAAALAHVTGEERFERDYIAWWDYATRYLIDLDKGSWRHELDEHNRPAASVWSGKPDVYHAYQATLFGTMPVHPVLSCALQQADARG